MNTTKARTRVEVKGFSISNVKTFRGREGMALECNILYNGKKVGTFYDDAYGGEPEVEFVPGFDMVIVDKACEELGVRFTFEGEDFPWTIEDIVDTLFNRNEEFKILKKAQKNGQKMFVYDSAKAKAANRVDHHGSLTCGNQVTEKRIMDYLFSFKNAIYSYGDVIIREIKSVDDFCID